MNIELIVLKMLGYGESSLILYCLSPDTGRISVLARGAKKITSKKFPEIGLFRVYNSLLIPPRKGDLYTLSSIDLMTSNDRLASASSLVEFAGAISRFSLSGSFEQVPCPVFYYCLLDCLQKIGILKVPINAWICRLLITYLMEQGLFPEIQLSQQQRDIISTLVDENSDKLEPLQFKEHQWQALKNWTLKTARFADIELPQSPYFSCC